MCGTNKKNVLNSRRNLSNERIRATSDSIPSGRVATYGQVALEAGLPGRARMVGKLLRELPPRSELPWHRVLGAGGKISLDLESASGQRQVKLLKAEGIEFLRPGRLSLKRFGWQPD
jgi:methylated-DNA-protein-cysteine methyltransferase-like protein